MIKTATRNDWIRNNNTRLIRNLIREQGKISKAELASISHLSFPTVSQAVKDLLELNEIEGIVGESSGGRPGNLYFINPECRFYFCAMLRVDSLLIRIYNYCGNEQGEASMPVDASMNVQKLIDFFSEVKKKYPLLTDGIMGIPGISADGVIWHFPHCRLLEQVNICKEIYDKLKIRVTLENDVNAIAMGESHLWNDFAHVIWTGGCIGSAVVLNGSVISGAHGCAGEVEFACHNLADRYLCLKDAMMAIYSVVDVPVIAFSGSEITKEDMAKLQEHMNKVLPEFRRPQLMYVEDGDSLYMKGLNQIMIRCFEEM